jgi:hypothetical protein
VIIIAGAFVGGMLDRWINLLGGVVFLVSGMAMMALMESELNILGFTMTTCVVSFLIGLVLLAAGLYGAVGTQREAELEEAFRQRRIPDPETHSWDFEGGPKPPEQTEQSRFA